MAARDVFNIWKCNECEYGGLSYSDEIADCNYDGQCDNQIPSPEQLAREMTIDKVIQCLEDHYNCNIDCLHDGDNEVSNVFAKNDVLMIEIIRPHDGNDNKWTLWVSALAAFDKWSNSLALEEQFDSVFDMWGYLMVDMTTVYRSAFQYLTDEHYRALDTIRDFQLP